MIKILLLCVFYKDTGSFIFHHDNLYNKSIGNIVIYIYAKILALVDEKTILIK